jgi:hypothetical protein
VAQRMAGQYSTEDGVTVQCGRWQASTARQMAGQYGVADGGPERRLRQAHGGCRAGTTRQIGGGSRAGTSGMLVHIFEGTTAK